MICKVCGKSHDDLCYGMCDACEEAERSFRKLEGTLDHTLHVLIRTAGKRRSFRWVYTQLEKLEEGAH